MLRRRLSACCLLLCSALLFTMKPTTVKADTFMTASIANDLTAEEKKMVYDFFGVPKENVQEFITNNADERKALLGIVSEAQIGNVTKSSALVEPTNAGGIIVETKNLTFVSDTMITNTLITLGVKNAKIKAVAPFPVSGTGALTGIIKCFENSKNSDMEITEEQKEVANEELVMTGQLGDSLGKDEASAVINEIKTQVIKDSPKTDIEIGNIVANVINNYNIFVSPENREKIVSVMSKINGLDIEYKDIKETLKVNKTNLKNKLENMGSELKESGWFKKSLTQIKSFGRWISEGFSKLGDYIAGFFSDEEVEEIKEKDGVKYDSKGNIVTEGNIFIPDENRTPDQIREEEKVEQVEDKNEYTTEQQGNQTENSVNGTLNKVE